MAKSCKMIEIVSDIDHLTEDKIKSVIKEKNDIIEKWVYILHDKDTHEDGTPKKPHYHVYLRFKDSRQLKHISQWFGVAENFLYFLHSPAKKPAFDDSCIYATHANAPDKFQYSVDEVSANFDYGAVVARIKNKVENALSKTSEISDIIDRIVSGEIKHYNETDFISPDKYVKYNRQIRLAFEYRLKMLSRKVDREMKVLYLYGGSGCGKSTYAKLFAQQHNLSVFLSSGSNDPFFGYLGQECVILDDLRGSVFPLSDLLKILDNNTSSTVKARYQNIALECEWLIITTTKKPEDFYSQVFESNSEEYKQFLRRCTYIGYVMADRIYFSAYNMLTSKLEPINSIKNPVKDILCLFESKKKKDISVFQISDSTVDSFAGISENAQSLDIDENGFFSLL